MAKKYFIRGGISPFDDLNVAERIARDVYGSNTGNLLYAYSVYRTLMVDDDTAFEPNHYQPSLNRIDEINETCDAFIIPLADAFRKDFVPELRNLTALVRNLKIPCIVTGVGLRAPYEPDYSERFSFDEDVAAFVRAVLEKSSMLGLRGELTGKYLQQLGFREETDYTVIGCPSMYYRGDAVRIKPLKLTEDSCVCMNFSINIPEELYYWIYTQGRRFENISYIPQQTSELRLAYAGTPYPGALQLPDYPGDITHPLLKADQYHAYTDVEPWLAGLSKADFSFGSKLHGNVAATLAGTPALMVCIDARMRELSEYHGLAHLAVDDVADMPDLIEIASKQDYHQVEKLQKQNLAHYHDFLKQNGLDTVFDHEYDGKLPFEKKIQDREDKTFVNYVLLTEEERVERMNAFYQSFIPVFSRYENGYKSLTQTQGTERRRITYYRGKYEENAASFCKPTGSCVVIQAGRFTLQEISELVYLVEEGVPELKTAAHNVYILTEKASGELRQIIYDRPVLYGNWYVRAASRADAVASHMLPDDCYEETLWFWGKLLRLKDHQELLCRAFLYDFHWKLQQGVIWPFMDDRERRNVAIKKAGMLFGMVPSRLIMACEDISKFHRLGMIALKQDPNISVVEYEDSVAVTDGDDVLWRSEKLEIVMTRFKPRNGRLEMAGFIKSPIFSFCEAPRLILQSKGNPEVEIPLSLSSWSRLDVRDLTNCFYHFALDLDVKKHRRLHLYVQMKEHRYDTYYYFMPDVVFNVPLKRFRIYEQGLEFKFNYNSILITVPDSQEEENYFRSMQAVIEEKNPDMAIWRATFYKQQDRKQKIWLYQLDGSALDNVAAQYIHDIKKTDGIRRCLVLPPKRSIVPDVLSEDNQYTKTHIGEAIEFACDEHKKLFCEADVLFTGEPQTASYNPFTTDEYACLIGTATMPYIVNMQNTCRLLNVPWRYSSDRIQADLNVLGIKCEQGKWQTEYGYTEKQITGAGLPRWDLLESQIKPQKKILYLPVNRPYLDRMIRTEKMGKTIFKQSEFYRNTKAFLTDPLLMRTLRETGYQIDVKFSLDMASQWESYDADEALIHLVSSVDRLEKYAAFVTDIADETLDFLYLDRKVLCFIPDENVLKSGLFSFSGYTSAAMLFQDGSSSGGARIADQLMDTLNRDCALSVNEKLKRRKLLFGRVSGACERVYLCVKRRILY